MDNLERKELEFVRFFKENTNGVSVLNIQHKKNSTITYHLHFLFVKSGGKNSVELEYFCLDNSYHGYRKYPKNTPDGVILRDMYEETLSVFVKQLISEGTKKQIDLFLHPTKLLPKYGMSLMKRK